jgi:hypothetical protein
MNTVNNSGTISGGRFFVDTFNQGAGGVATISGGTGTVNNANGIFLVQGVTTSATFGTVTGTLTQSSGNVVVDSVGGDMNQNGGTLKLNNVTNFTQTSGSAQLQQSAINVSQTAGGTIAFDNNFSLTGGAASTLNGVTSINGPTGSQVNGVGALIFGGTTNLDFTKGAGGGASGIVSDNFITTGGIVYGGQLNLNLTSMSGTFENAEWGVDVGTVLFGGRSYTGNLSGITAITSGAYAAISGQPWYLASTGNAWETNYGPGVWLSPWTNNTKDGQRFIFNQVDGTLTVVPEPSTIVFAGIGAAMLGWHTWTRSRRKARMKLVEEHFRKVSEARGLV